MTRWPPWVLLGAAGCAHHPSPAPPAADPLYVVVMTTGPGRWEITCTAFQTRELTGEGTLIWGADGSILRLDVHREGTAWTGALQVWTGPDELRHRELGSFNAESGVNASVTTQRGDVGITLTPTARPSFLLAACLGRPDLTVLRP
jgi:hypothetical protein